MSASTKKKLRKAEAAENMTDRQKKQSSESKKTTLMTVAFVLALVLIVGVFLFTLGRNIVKQNGLIEKATIAATVGNHKLNSVTMNYFYMDAIEADYTNAQQTAEYYNSMGASTTTGALLGYDLSKPLSAQTNATTGKTWAQHYWDIALNNAKTVYAMYDLAVAANYQLPAEYTTTIDQNIQSMEFSAMFSQTDLDGFISSIYGNGANEKNYREYQVIKATASAYYQNHQDTKTFTNDERAAYLSAHPNDFTAYSFNYYTANYTSYLPKKEGENPTYTEEENQAARDAAKKDAEALAAVTSVADLDAAIAALPVNEGKTAKSSNAPDVMHSTSSFTEEQLSWISAADRKTGDAKCFANVTSTDNADGTKTEVTNSYIVMMYVSKNEHTTPMGNVRHLLVSFEHDHADTAHDHSSSSYTEAEKATAKAEAEKILADWVAAGDTSEASFIELVKKHSDDTASVANGGLYENIGKNSGYEANFEAWAIDPARKAGEYEIVSTAHGYHIMFFTGSDELSLRDGMINAKLLSEHMTTWEEQVVGAVTVTPGKTKRIKFDIIVGQYFGM